LPGERNPQSAAEEFAPPPQGESVLDASMMAELIVTNKEIGPQLKKSAGTSRVRPNSPARAGNDCRYWEGIGLSIPFFDSLVPGSGAVLAEKIAASVRTPVEENIGTYTAAWTQVIQGHSQDRWHGARQRIGHAGLNMASGHPCKPGALSCDYASGSQSQTGLKSGLNRE
jgi:hypothetical protein